MALVNASATPAKNAVMILQRIANTPNNVPVIAAYMRGTHYSFEKVYVGYYGVERGYIYKNSTSGPMSGTVLSENNTAAVPTFQRITLSDNLIKVEMFTTQPGVTGGTPTYTLTATNSDYLASGTWQYDNAYSSLVLFTSLDVVNYTVTYNANGGSVTPTSAVYSGTPLTLPTPTRAGYTFNGWYTAATGGTLVNSPYTPTANITLYAQWTLITYSVTYDANGGSGTAPAIQSGSSSYTVATNTFTRSGYAFNGWNTAADGTGSSYSEGSTITPSANTTLYAQWVSTAPENTIHVQDSAKATNVYVEEVLAQHFYIQDIQVF